jgi:hypothetical protein
MTTVIIQQSVIQYFYTSLSSPLVNVYRQTDGAVVMGEHVQVVRITGFIDFVHHSKF